MMAVHAVQDQIVGLLTAAVGSGVIPGAVLASGGGEWGVGDPEVVWVGGRADTTAGAERELRRDTRFDLASLTKVVSTLPLILSLIAEGDLALDSEVASVLPGAFDQTSGPVYIEHLLTHSSGLPAMAELWKDCATVEQARQLVRDTVPLTGPARHVVYSDVGFMMLGQIVERLTGLALAEAFDMIVARPLGLSHSGFGPIDATVAAATEPDERGVPWVGVVHDENARFLGGAAGHAGLFSTVDDLAGFARWWLSGEDLVVPVKLRRSAEVCRTNELDGRRGLGWTCRGDRYDILPGWPAGAVSHTGFTGTSLALDRTSGTWAVLLTNAVHFGRKKEAIKALRRGIHTALAPSG